MNEVNIMLQEAKLAMAITTSAYDGEIADLLDAGARDLKIAGVVLPGTVAFVVTENGVQDYSTLVDRLVMRAIITYARMNFRNPDDYERLRESYDMQKVQLMHASDYTDYDGGEVDG
jgi:hypothetical protein